MNITFIGAGNLAWHLAPAFDNAGFPVKEVFSRNIDNAQALIEKLYDARATVSPDFSFSSSKIFIIAIADDAVREVVSSLVLPPRCILVHTSGSLPLSALAYAGVTTTGVFYPLQTFSRNRRVNFQDVPVFVESEDPETVSVLKKLGAAITKKVYTISSADRKAIHVAAVFASNFTNHMLTLAKEIMSENHLDFEYLKPLIAETVTKALTLGPESSQTGPARRGDLEILDRHMEFLGNDEEVAEIYRVISQHIVDRYVSD